MGRHRFKSMSYKEITAQTERTIIMLMKAAHIKTNSDATKEQSVSRALGAVVLWEDLTSSNASTEDDKQRLYNLLVCDK
jgi:hypothetical protein